VENKPKQVEELRSKEKKKSRKTRYQEGKQKRQPQTWKTKEATTNLNFRGQNDSIANQISSLRGLASTLLPPTETRKAQTEGLTL
jgi:DNA replication protein DnaC